MAARKIKRIFLPLQTTHHMAAFKSAGNQGGQFRRIDVGTDLAASLPLLGNRLQTVKPGTESLASFRSQLRIAIVGIDCRVQQRASSRHHPGAPVSKVPHNLFEAVNRIRNLLCAFEARIYCEFPSVVERVSRKLLLAPKMPVDSALF